MAYVQNLNQDDQQQQQGQTNTQGQQGVNVSGTSSGPTSVSNAGSTTGGNRSAPTSSGTFQNIQNYLKANSGYNNGQGLVGQVGSDLSKKESQTEQDINQGYNNFANEAKQSDINYDPSVIQRIVSGNASDTDKQLAQKYYNAQSQYQASAPQGFDASQQYANKMGSLNNLLGYAKGNSDSNRMTLLQQMYGNPGYSVGQQSLDNLLLSGSSQGLQNLQNTANSLSGKLNTAYSGAQKQSSDLLSQLASDASNAQTQARQDVQNAYQGIQGNLSQQAAQLQAARQKAYNDMFQQLQASTNPISGTGVKQIDVTPYITNQVGTATGADVVSAQQRAALAALANLSGQSNWNLGAGSNLSALPYTVDNAGLQAAIAARAQGYIPSLGAPQQSNIVSQGKTFKGVQGPQIANNTLGNARQPGGPFGTNQGF